MKKLTEAQVYTMRRMGHGTRYFCRGDGKKGEQEKIFARGSVQRINAPSIPVLMRLGLVKFRNNNPTLLAKNAYFIVNLTDEGWDLMMEGMANERGND